MYDDIKEYKGTHPRKWYRMISGEKRCVEDLSVIARCSSITHPGFLTLPDIVQHQCFFKRCPYLRKLQNNSFWQEPQREYKRQMERRFSLKGHNDLQAQQQRWEKDAKNKCPLLMEFSEEWVKTHSLENEFKITSVQPFNDSTKNFRLFYVSNQTSYDAPFYVDLVKAIQAEFHCRIKLVHIKDINGKRVTIDEYIHRKQLFY